MPETAPEQSHIDGTSAGGETIQAPAGNSSIAGDGGGDRLVGSSGDNTFFIDSPLDVVVEGAPWAAGPIRRSPIPRRSWRRTSRNLTVHQDFNFAVGNNLDNLIIVDGSRVGRRPGGQRCAGGLDHSAHHLRGGRGPGRRRHLQLEQQQPAAAAGARVSDPGPGSGGHDPVRPGRGDPAVGQSDTDRARGHACRLCRPSTPAAAGHLQARGDDLRR